MSSSVAVADTMPAQLTGVTWTCAATGGATCTAAGSGNISDTIALPVGATVKFAGLYWGADTTAGTSGSAAPAPAQQRPAPEVNGGNSGGGGGSMWQDGVYYGV